MYEINMLRCIFCGLCEEACPKEAIFMTNEELAPAGYNRGDFLFGKDRLVEKEHHPNNKSKGRRPIEL